MKMRMVSSTCRRGWLTLPLAAILLAGACDRPQPTAPEAVGPVAPGEQRLVAQIAFEVDPVSGTVRMLDEQEIRARGGEAARALVPVTPDHVEASARCRGCNDRILDNQWITVRFTLRHFLIERVDFQRTSEGDAIAAMTCVNCRVRSAELRGVEPSPMPAELGPGHVFEAVLRVDALQLRPFAVHFNLLANAIDVPAYFTQVDAGWSHNCALRDDGTLACWGSNDWGESEPPAGSFTQVSAGGGYTCARRPDATLVCWGLNYLDRATPPPGTYAQVSAGAIHGCAVRTDGTLACWGDNGWGQLDGIPSGTFTQVSAAVYHSCAVRTGGLLACWGWDFWGQASPPSGTFTQVSVKDEHSCGLRSDGTVACWGNIFDEIDPPAGHFLQVTAGEKHSCALRADGTFACWGHNGWGQATPPSGTFTQVSAGAFHTCAVRTNGLLACRGRDWDDEVNPPLR
jgi:hypothetical protein